LNVPFNAVCPPTTLILQTQTKPAICTNQNKYNSNFKYNYNTSTMGRRRLLPNINNLLLQLHLPHRSGNSSISSSGKVVVNTGNEAGKDFHDHETEAPICQKSLGSSSSLSGCETSSDHENNENENNHVDHHHVSFGNCEIRTYTQVLGDHPCCSEGCPIQLGWSYTSEESIKVDDYERFRVDAPHKCLHELRLTAEERRSILILSKQQCLNNSEGSDNDDQSDCDSHSSALVVAMDDDHCCVDLDPHQHSHSDQLQQQQHERELIRECRRLNRCGGWNVNVKATRKRNKRNQQAFFGAPTAMPTTTTI
jgi:hypothetical protein